MRNSTKEYIYTPGQIVTVQVMSASVGTNKDPLYLDFSEAPFNSPTSKQTQRPRMNRIEMLT